MPAFSIRSLRGGQDSAQLSLFLNRGLLKQSGLSSRSLAHQMRNALRLLRPTRASILGIPRRARKRNRVAHVRQPRHIGERALEAEPETRMRHGAVAAQIAVPAVVLLVD